MDKYEKWLRYVMQYHDALCAEAGFYSVEGLAGDVGQRASRSPVDEEGGLVQVLLCSPHPDDEALSGMLALRMAETGAQVTNLALTLGSDTARKDERLREMRASCDALGFGWQELDSLVGTVSPLTKGQDPARWRKCVNSLLEVFFASSPVVVLFPHCRERHPTHAGVHHLASAALLEYTGERQCEVLGVQWEYWSPLVTANLLLGMTPELAARGVAALALHEGEMRRNPYHLREPARLIDNVRRGSEFLGGYGAAGTSFVFGALYYVSRFVNGFEERSAESLVVSSEQPVTRALLRSLFA